MNISLPSALKAFVDSHVATGHYATASEYVRELIRNQVKAQGKLEEFLLDGLEGMPTAWVDEDSEALLRLAATGQ